MKEHIQIIVCVHACVCIWTARLMGMCFTNCLILDCNENICLLPIWINASIGFKSCNLFYVHIIMSFASVWVQGCAWNCAFDTYRVCYLQSRKGTARPEANAAALHFSPWKLRVPKHWSKHNSPSKSFTAVYLVYPSSHLGGNAHVELFNDLLWLVLKRLYEHLVLVAHVFFFFSSLLFCVSPGRAL